jgi:hypothetical protein
MDERKLPSKTGRASTGRDDPKLMTSLSLTLFVPSQALGTHFMYVSDD